MSQRALTTLQGVGPALGGSTGCKQRAKQKLCEVCGDFRGVGNEGESIENVSVKL